MPKGQRRSRRLKRELNKIDKFAIAANEQYQNHIGNESIRNKPSKELFTICRSKADSVTWPKNSKLRNQIRSKPLTIERISNPVQNDLKSTFPSTRPLPRVFRHSNNQKHVASQELEGNDDETKIPPSKMIRNDPKHKMIGTSEQYDLWHELDTEKQKNLDQRQNSLLEPDWIRPDKRAGYLKKRSNRKPNAIKAFHCIDAGESYLPTPDDHSKSLQKTVEFYKKIIDHQTLYDQLLPHPPVNDTFIVFEDYYEDEEDQDDKIEMDDSPAPKKEPVPRKTTGQRAFMAKSRTAFARAALISLKEKYKKQYEMLDHFVESADKSKLKADKKRAAKRLFLLEQKPYMTQKLGKYKFQEPAPIIDTEYNPTQSLRTIIPRSSIFADRFSSFQRRNYIEADK